MGGERWGEMEAMDEGKLDLMGRTVGRCQEAHLGMVGGSATLRSQKLGTHLRHKVLEASNDVGALELLIVTKAASDHNHGNEGQRQV